MSAEVTTSFEWNKVTTETVPVTDAVGIKTPPGKSVQAKRTWMISSFNMPYRAVGKVKFDSYPEMLPVHIEGTYEGVATHDVQTWWIEIPPRSGSKAAMVTGAIDDAGQLMVGPDDGNREGWKLIQEAT